MNHRMLLLSSAAAIALSSSAWANQGDTYLSFFGGYSTAASGSFEHTKSATAQTTVSSFQRRAVLANQFTKVHFTSTTPTFYRSVLNTFTVIGTYNRFYKLTKTTDFVGEIGTDGWVVGAALGVELFGGFRGEAEAAFRRFDLNQNASLDHAMLYRRRNRYDAYYSYDLPVSTGTHKTKQTTTFINLLTTVHAVDRTTVHSGSKIPAHLDGELTAFSLMANLWYDFPLGDSGFTPFIGAGIGVANLTLSYDFKARQAIPQYVYNNIATSKTIGPGTTVNTNIIKTTDTVMTTIKANFKDDDAVFAYQFGAGIGYEFNNGVRLAAQYRYFATMDGDFGNISQNVESSDVIFSLSVPFGRGN